MYLNDFVKRASESILEYEEPLKYLDGRGINREDIKRFCIGYVRVARIRDDGSAEYKQFRESTYNFRVLQNKIIFPLRNVLGHVNGLVLRDLNKKLYIQHFLTEAKKIGAFFGLYEALPHIVRTRKVFIHEGAINALSFSKVFPNTISSLTSFLNEQQFELLKFFVDKCILVYDKDFSGYLGIKKSLERYGERYIDHIFLGDNDANSVYCTMGHENFLSFVKSKVPILYQD